ncbi:hypothetical protein ACHAXT_009694 [Thalassiosira profunda]
MGHPTRLFSSPPAEGVVCIICFDVLEDAVCTRECGHTFCEGCITQALNVNDASSCPNCRVVVTGTNPNYSLREVVDSMSVNCPQGHPCNWTGLVKDLRRHDGVCPFKSVACAVVGCGHECKRQDMEEHNTSTQGIVTHMELRYEQKMRDMEQKHKDAVAAMEQKFDRKLKKKVKEIGFNMRLETNHMRYVNDCRGWIEHCNGWIEHNKGDLAHDFDVFEIRRLDHVDRPISGLLCKIECQGAFYPMVVRYEKSFNPPTCKFPRGFFHLNVCPNGALRSKDFAWGQETALSGILLNVQLMLRHPSPGIIRQRRAGDLFGTPSYQARAKEEADKYRVHCNQIYNHPKVGDMLEEGEGIVAIPVSGSPDSRMALGHL